MSLKGPNSRHSDVAVVGGGLIGSSIALRLAQTGLRVTVFERGTAGREASSAAAGMIAPQAEKMGPPQFDQLCRLSHSIYPDFAAEIESLTGKEVNYRRDGTLLLALDEAQAAELQEIQFDAGVERLDPDAARRRVSGLADEIRSALFISGDHWVNNERLTPAVIEAAKRQGVTFQENMPVRGIRVSHERVEGIETDRDRVTAGEVILAAGCWSATLAATSGIEIPMRPCRGQILEFELDSPLPMVVRAGHSYLVPREANVVLVGTTAEYAGFEARVTAEGISEVLRAGLRLVPILAGGRFRRAWAGLRPDTADHLPVLGRCGIEGLTLATGHFRNGILLTPVTAHLIADLVIKGTAPPLLEPFRAERFALAARSAQGRTEREKGESEEAQVSAARGRY
ncbi:MAG TPA: glycine oxidase ThiO [Terriglobia bacterium]|nr:glycine oxidase ThiO [Terriglobia bacterium]